MNNKQNIDEFLANFEEELKPYKELSTLEKLDLILARYDEALEEGE